METGQLSIVYAENYYEVHHHFVYCFDHLELEI